MPALGRSRRDLNRRLFNWLEAAGVAPLATLNALRAAIRLFHYARLSESDRRFRLTGEVAAWPSVGLMSRDLGVSEETVRRSLRHLQKANLVEIAQSEGGRTKTNTYILLPQKPPHGSGSVANSENHQEPAPVIVGSNPRVESSKSPKNQRGGSPSLVGKDNEHARARASRDAAPEGETASRRGAEENHPFLMPDGSLAFLTDMTPEEEEALYRRHRSREIHDPHADD